MSKIVHYAIDAVLISTVLAGIKRSTGLQPATSKISSDTLRDYVDKYFEMGEWVLDSSASLLGNTSYFTKDNTKKD